MSLLTVTRGLVYFTQHFPSGGGKTRYRKEEEESRANNELGEGKTGTYSHIVTPRIARWLTIEEDLVDLFVLCVSVRK